MAEMSRERRLIQSANSLRQALHFWTDERVATMRECAADGFSLAECADVIGEGCTRCAVAGKAAALGIKFDGRGLTIQQNRPKWIRYRIAKLKREIAALEREAVEHETSSLGVSRETEAEAA